MAGGPRGRGRGRRPEKGPTVLLLDGSSSRGGGVVVPSPGTLPRGLSFGRRRRRVSSAPAAAVPVGACLVAVPALLPALLLLLQVEDRRGGLPGRVAGFVVEPVRALRAVVPGHLPAREHEGRGRGRRVIGAIVVIVVIAVIMLPVFRRSFCLFPPRLTVRRGGRGRIGCIVLRSSVGRARQSLGALSALVTVSVSGVV